MGVPSGNKIKKIIFMLLLSPIHVYLLLWLSWLYTPQATPGNPKTYVTVYMTDSQRGVHKFTLGIYLTLPYVDCFFTSLVLPPIIIIRPPRHLTVGIYTLPTMRSLDMEVHCKQQRLS